MSEKLVEDEDQMNLSQNKVGKYHWSPIDYKQS